MLIVPLAAFVIETVLAYMLAVFVFGLEPMKAVKAVIVANVVTTILIVLLMVLIELAGYLWVLKHDSIAHAYTSFTAPVLTMYFIVASYFGLDRTRATALYTSQHQPFWQRYFHSDSETRLRELRKIEHPYHFLSSPLPAVGFRVSSVAFHRLLVLLPR